MYTSKIDLPLMDSVGPQGFLQIFRMSGEHPRIEGGQVIFDPRKTSLHGSYNDENMVVDAGRRNLNEFLAGVVRPELVDFKPLKYFVTGTGGYIGAQDPEHDPAPPLGTDTQLYAQLFKKQIMSVEVGVPNALASVYVTTITENESNGSLTEFGLMTAESAAYPDGRLFARRTTRPMWKDANVFFVCRWTIQF